MSPENIYFLTSLPLTRSSFDKDPVESDFIRHFKVGKGDENPGNLWNQYENEIVAPYKNLKKYFSKTGIQFMEDITLNRFAEVLVLKQQKLIIYLSHCAGGGTLSEAIEFSDGLVHFEKLVAVTPEDYDKILDFSVCNPVKFADMAQTRRPQMVVRYTAKPISIIYWILFYTEMLAEMITNNGNYFSAYKTALYKMLNIKNEKTR
jgi:hypothetical protein